jgi:hypothetical protein
MEVTCARDTVAEYLHERPLICVKTLEREFMVILLPFVTYM